MKLYLSLLFLQHSLIIGELATATVKLISTRYKGDGKNHPGNTIPLWKYNYWRAGKWRLTS